MEALKWLFSLLWPPTHEDPHLNRWQKHMAGSMIITASAILGLALAATGSLEPYGVSGFASANEIAKVQQSTNEVRQATNDIQARLIERDIYDAKRDQCKAMREDDVAAKPSILRRLEELREDYRKVTGRNYRDLGCDEI